MPDALKNIAYEFILEKLQDSHFRGGDMLSEAALAKSLGTSRGPVREAITRLASEGFLEQVPGSGTYIRIPERKELEELYQVREWLESFAAAEGAVTLEPAVIEQLEERQAQMQAWAANIRELLSEEDLIAAHDRFRRVDRDFHQVLLAGVGNRLLMKTVGNLGLLMRIFVAWRETPGPTMVQSGMNTLAEHGAILAALRAHDPAAAASQMREHIHGARRRVLAQYDLEHADSQLDNTLSEVPSAIQRRVAHLRRYRPGGSPARRNEKAAVPAG